jgi:hypothetical protein
MTEGLIVALVAAGAAVLGGLLTAFATRSVEKMRFKQAVEEKTAERKLAAVVRFTNAAFAWFDWLVLMAEQGLGGDVLTEYKERSRDVSRRIASSNWSAQMSSFSGLERIMIRWSTEFGLSSVPLCVGGARLPQETAPLLREYREMLYKTLIDRFRPEIRPLQATSVSVEVFGTRFEFSD